MNKFINGSCSKKVDLQLVLEGTEGLTFPEVDWKIIP